MLGQFAWASLRSPYSLDVPKTEITSVGAYSEYLAGLVASDRVEIVIGP